MKRNTDPRRYSRVVMDGDKQAPARAMLRAVGFHDEDFGKPQIGVASTWGNVTPCNAHIGELAREACASVDADVGVAGRDISPGRGDADLGLAEVLIVKAHRAQHGARRRLLVT